MWDVLVVDVSCVPSSIFCLNSFSANFPCIFITDIDECAGDNNCSPNADCVNIPGAYQCQCRDGYEGDGLTCIGMCE